MSSWVGRNTQRWGRQGKTERMRDRGTLPQTPNSSQLPFTKSYVHDVKRLQSWQSAAKCPALGLSWWLSLITSNYSIVNTRQPSSCSSAATQWWAYVKVNMYVSDTSISPNDHYFPHACSLRCFCSWPTWRSCDGKDRTSTSCLWWRPRPVPRHFSEWAPLVCIPSSPGQSAGSRVGWWTSGTDFDLCGKPQRPHALGWKR